LLCGGSSLTSLDVLNNPFLTELDCGGSSLSSLDVTQNTALTKLYCNDNSLTILNVANGNNTNFSNFFTGNNPNLTCVTVDNVTYSTTNWTNIDAQTSFSTNCNVVPCTVTIPDANFKAYLVGNALINTNGNTEIECSEATAFAGAISVFNQGVTDLTGIEAFTALTSLNCGNNTLITIDVSQNTALTTLRCVNASLTALDVSQNVSLTLFTCGNNTLSSLNVTQNIALITFECYNNALTSLDISQNVSLESFSCNGNSINSLDVSQNTNLDDLFCYDNSMNSLDVSYNINLTRLFCYENSLTSLDVSNNTLLEILRCTDNSLTALDVSNNSNLITLVCSNNNLTELNIANGNNTNIGSGGVTGIVSVNNPNLSCIQVDNVAYSTTNWVGTYFQFDPIISFSTNCIGLVTSIIVQGQGGVTTITTPGGTLQMEATVLPANATDGTYTWAVSSQLGAASIDANGLLTVTANGIVTVIASANDNSNVIGSATITVSNQSTGINEINAQKLSVFPNPTKNQLTISGVNTSVLTISIVDVTGKMVKVIEGNSAVINVSDLTQGIYFLQIQTEQGLYNSKFIKE